jgi:hypothetical protein
MADCCCCCFEPAKIYCAGCALAYCDSACLKRDWRRGHRQRCQPSDRFAAWAQRVQQLSGIQVRLLSPLCLDKGAALPLDLATRSLALQGQSCLVLRKSDAPTPYEAAFAIPQARLPLAAEPLLIFYNGAYRATNLLTDTADATAIWFAAQRRCCVCGAEPPPDCWEAAWSCHRCAACACSRCAALDGTLDGTLDACPECRAPQPSFWLPVQ